MEKKNPAPITFLLKHGDFPHQQQWSKTEREPCAFCYTKGQPTVKTYLPTCECT